MRRGALLIRVHRNFVAIGPGSAEHRVRDTVEFRVHIQCGSRRPR